MPAGREAEVKDSKGWVFAIHRGPARARFRLAASSFLCAQKGSKDQRLAPLRRILQKPFLLYAPKETVFEIQRKALSGPLVQPSIDRRAWEDARSAAFRCRATAEALSCGAATGLRLAGRARRSELGPQAQLQAHGKALAEEHLTFKEPLEICAVDIAQ